MEGRAAVRTGPGRGARAAGTRKRKERGAVAGGATGLRNATSVWAPGSWLSWGSGSPSALSSDGNADAATAAERRTLRPPTRRGIKSARRIQTERRMCRLALRRRLRGCQAKVLVGVTGTPHKHLKMSSLQKYLQADSDSKGFPGQIGGTRGEAGEDEHARGWAVMLTVVIPTPAG